MIARPAGRIWLAPLDAVASEAERHGLDWLSDDESSRLQAMTAPLRRSSFLAGHWHARELASAWLRIERRRIALHRHGDGRPLLLVDGAASPLSLSLSHSGDWLASAIADVPIGIDVELPRRARDLQALARFAFAPEEAQRLSQLAEQERIAAFHELWTLKEARGKRSGEGLLPAQSRRIATLPSDAGSAEATSWAFRDGALALAVDAGTTFSIEGGESLGDPRHWRYVDAG